MNTQKPNLAKLRENYMKYVKENTRFTGTEDSLEWCFLEFLEKKGILKLLKLKP